MGTPKYITQPAVQEHLDRVIVFSGARRWAQRANRAFEQDADLKPPNSSPPRAPTMYGKITWE